MPQNNSFQIRIADQVVEIHALYEDISGMCRDYAVSGEKPDITVRVTEEDLVHELEMARRDSGRLPKDPGQLRKEPGQLLPEKDPSGQPGGTGAEGFQPPLLRRYEPTAVYRKIVSAMTDTFLMHGSVISTQGLGYMLTAPSGVGKTTRTKLWIDELPDSFVVNGDKPLIRVKDGEIRIYGTPWSGKERWNTNTSVPLRAIFLLERADEQKEPGDSGSRPEGSHEPAARGAVRLEGMRNQAGSNSVTELTFAEAFPTLLAQTFRPEEIEAKRRTLRMLNALAGKARFFRFVSAPTSQAVRMAWEAAR